MKLAVGEDIRIQTAHIVHLRAPVNPHLGQDTLNEFQVRFAPLGNQLPRRVSALQAELKVRPLQAVAAQHLLHHLRDGPVLKEAALAGMIQQGQAGTQNHLIMRLVDGGGEPFQAGDDAVHDFPAAHAKRGILHQHLFREDVRLRGGELDLPAKGST